MRLESIEMEEKEKDETVNILFWKLFDENTIGVVTSKSVYYWKMSHNNNNNNNSKPQKMFDHQCVLADATVSVISLLLF